MTPASRFSSALSPDDAAALRTLARDATAPSERVRWPVRVHRPARAPSPQSFELRCADIHPLYCQEVLRAESLTGLVAVARQHGALDHGFTPVWYSPQRLAVIAGAVMQRRS